MKELSAALNEYLTFCQYEKNLGGLTIKAYRQDLAQFMSLMKDIQFVGEVNKELIRNYVRTLFDSKLKETSIRRKIASLKAFLRYLEFEDDIPVSPFRKLNVQIKVPKRVPRYLGLNDVRVLISSTRSDFDRIARGTNSCASNNTASNSNPFSAPQDIVILELLFSTGIRVSELCNLRTDDVDTFKRSIRVVGKGSRERTVPITHQEVIDLLTRFLAERSRRNVQHQYLLTNRLGRRTQPHSVRALLRRLSVKTKLSVKVTPHMFRHTIATLLIEQGIDTRFVQKFLGHSSILTTQIYTHLSTVAEREMIGNRHRRNFI